MPALDTPQRGCRSNDFSPLLRLPLFILVYPKILGVRCIYKNAEIYFYFNKLMLSPKAMGGRFRLRRGTLKRPNTRPEKRRAPKAFWGSTPHAFLVGRPNPSGGRKEKFAQPKSGKLALHGSGVAFVVFVTVYWSDRFPTIDCSNSAHKGPDQKCGQCRFLHG